MTVASVYLDLTWLAQDRLQPGAFGSPPSNPSYDFPAKVGFILIPPQRRPVFDFSLRIRWMQAPPQRQFGIGSYPVVLIDTEPELRYTPRRKGGLGSECYSII